MGGAPLDDLDHWLLRAAYGGMHGAWSPLMVALTVLGSGWAAVPLLPLSVWSRTRSWALVLAVAIVSQAVAVWSLKRAFGRVRPWIALGLSPPIGSPSDFSFPSGHAAGSFCVAAFVFIVLRADVGDRSEPRARRAVAAGAVVLAALIALSRVYLGAHFPGDVVAGAILGSVFGGAAGGLYARRPRSER
jgi:undecaprenyl-diphosphatase